jgi:hypothetical protein
MPRHQHPESGAVSRVPAVSARVLASAIDLALIWSWLGLLTGGGFLLRRRLGRPAGDAEPPMLAVDAAVFAGTILPVAGYFVATEGWSGRASIGKRLVGLGLEAHPSGGRVASLRVVVRTCIKLFPWQLAHLYVARTMSDRGSPVVAKGAQALSLALAVVSVLFALRDPHQRALHDRVVGSRVIIIE